MPRRTIENTDPELVWEAPVVRRNVQPSMYDEIITQVKGNPGRWARIRVLKYSSAHSAAGSLRKRLEDDERWEVTIARIEDQDGLGGIYLRYRSDEQMKAKR